MTVRALGIDLGWVVCRQLTREAMHRINHVRTYPQVQAMLAAYAGLSRAQFKKLTAEQRDELWHVHLWMMRPFDQPRIGKLVEL